MILLFGAILSKPLLTSTPVYATAPRKIEYKDVEVSEAADFSGSMRKQFEKLLNKYGTEGWE